jgi:hypothetical protein
MRLAVGLVSAILPIREGGLVNAEEVLTLNRFHLKVESSPLKVFAQVAGMGWILV